MAPGSRGKASGWEWAQGSEVRWGAGVRALGWAAWAGNLVPLLPRRRSGLCVLGCSEPDALYLGDGARRALPRRAT